MTFSTTPIAWLDHGAGEAHFDNGMRIRNLNNINVVQVKSGGAQSTVGPDEFVDALNQIGFTVSAKADLGLGKAKTLGASSDPFAAAWEQAEPGEVKVGDRVITRTAELGGYSYGTFTAVTEIDDPRIRVLERKPEPEPLPEWMEAQVIRAYVDGRPVLAERDEDDDWLVYGLDNDPLAGEYIFCDGAPEKRFEGVEVIA